MEILNRLTRRDGTFFSDATEISGMRPRHGIAPVVAVVLLLLMSVTAAGGSYAWITTTTQQAQTGASESLATGVAFRDIDCRGINVSFGMTNTGDRQLASTEARVLVSADGDLVGSSTTTVSDAGFRRPGGFGREHVLLDETTDRGRAYQIEVTFPMDDLTVQRGCESQGTMVGEAHRVDVTNTSWTTVEFIRNYSDPVVLATANTVDTGDHPLNPQARNVAPHSAEVRLCEHENADGCADFGTETLGVVVLDAGIANDTTGMRAGTATLSATSGGNRAGQGISIGTSFPRPPVGFVTPLGVNENTDYVTWVTGASTNSINVGYCDHNESAVDSCESHPEERVAWLAIDDQQFGLSNVDANRSSAKPGGTTWVTESHGASDPAVALGMIQGDEGGQDPKTTEMRNVGGGTLDIHFCEHDSDDVCNGHSDNWLAWLAAGEGMILR